MTLWAFPGPSAPAPVPFISTQGTKFPESTAATSPELPRPRVVVLPVRRHDAAADPQRERHQRLLETGANRGMGDLFHRAAAGLEGEGRPAAERAEFEAAAIAIDTCRTRFAIQDAECGALLTFPRSCHVRGEPRCERQRSRELVRRLEAAVDQIAGGESNCSMIVVTAVNPPRGELARGRRRHFAHLARLRRSAPFAGGPCTWPGHRSAHDHAGVGGGFLAVECPASQRTPGTWNLHTNIVIAGTRADPAAAAPYIEWAELSWWWRRITCAHHRSRCPGLVPTSDGQRPPRCTKCGPGSWTKLEDHGGCAGGAWDVNIAKLRDVHEAVKYATKAGELLDLGGDALLEWWLAMRRAKLVQPFGSFYGVAFKEDRRAQERADDEAGLERVWITEQRRGMAPRICPVHGGRARWVEAMPVVVSADDPGLAMIGGFLMWRAPPEPREGAGVPAAVPRASTIADVTSPAPLDAWLARGPLVVEIGEPTSV